MQCPHSILKHGWKEGLAATVAKYRIGAKTCSACDFLLRVVEEYLPGWIDEGINGSLRIIELCFWVTHKFWCPPLVILRQIPQVENPTVNSSQEDQLPDGWDENAYNVGSFCCFRLPQNEASFTDVYSPIFDTGIVIRESLDIIENSSSSMAFDRAARWLSHCLENDDACRIPNPNYMPRRLLNVGSDQSLHPFLFEPTRAEPYVCLSYCWGSDVHDVLKTTNENLQSHHEAISLAAFPQTIRDAVRVCRSLKLQYLWVDSICIVQDDPTGWLHDSAQMRDIYANSYLTISAQEPPSCKEGFLGPQEFGQREWQRKVISHVPPDVGGPGNEVLIRPINVFKEPVESYSLDKRAWCLQENILPNRILCFNGEEMTWSCVCRRICECGHASWNPPRDQRLHYHEIASKLKQGYDGTKPNAPYEDWMVLVEDYSDRSLTQGMDKLTALSGLARMICDTPITTRQQRSTTNLTLRRDVCTTVDTYAAGLWKNHFVHDLTWRTIKPKPINEKSQSYRAPSWSWASIDGSVRFDYHRRIRLFKMFPTTNPKPKVEINCTINEIFCKNILHSDPTSGVLAAHAILTGPLVEVDLVTLDLALSRRLWKPKEALLGYPISLVRPNSLKSFQVSLDYIQPSFLGSESPQAHCWMRGTCLKNGCSCSTPTKPQFYCLSLFASMSNSGGEQGDTHIEPESFFLVLQKSENIEGAFERIGMGSACSWWFSLFSEADSCTVTIV